MHKAPTSEKENNDKVQPILVDVPLIVTKDAAEDMVLQNPDPPKRNRPVAFLKSAYLF